MNQKHIMEPKKQTKQVKSARPSFDKRSRNGCQTCKMRKVKCDGTDS